MDQARPDPTRIQWQTLAWAVVIAGASTGFSLAFACATPFAALAAIAAMQLRRPEAVGTALLAWIANQAIGYLVLHYPRTWDSFAWGAAIGLAAVFAVLSAAAMVSLSKRTVAKLAMCFATAFATYEGTLFVASFVLPSEGNAFALPIVARILEVDLVAFAALIVLHRLAVGLGLLPKARERMVFA